MRILISMFLFFCIACSKEAVVKNDDAVIINVRYACGAACDASTYVMKVGDSYYVSSEPLLDEYRQHNLQVTICYLKTGRFPVLWEGPTNAEIIEIKAIRKR